MNKTIHILTYPRCGSVYLTNLLADSFRIPVYKKHLNNTDHVNMMPSAYYANLESESFQKDNYIITILRDPVDSITSLCSMENFYNENYDIDYHIEKNTEYYITSFKTISKFANLIINFNDINVYKDNIVKFISDETNNKIFNKKYVSRIIDVPEDKFLKSSKITENYEYIKEKVKLTNLTECYEIYNNLIKRCKVFNINE